MQKITAFLLTCLLVLALPLVAGAEKEKYKSDSYQFSNVKMLPLRE